MPHTDSDIRSRDKAPVQADPVADKDIPRERAPAEPQVRAAKAEQSVPQVRAAEREQVQAVLPVLWEQQLLTGIRIPQKADPWA